ncbi:MAG: RDD family protein [Actinobacteria bacterium]|nr:RDD family protein [Actinomycetota bacterium]
MTEPEPSRRAGIVSRGVAAFIDLLVVGAVIGGLYVGLVLTTLMLNPTSFRFPALSVVFSSAMGIAVSVLYLAGCWAVSGCTVGAVVMGLRVVGRRGGRLRPAVALLRAVGCVLVPIGLAWVAVDRQRRSVQDIVLGSRVVYTRQ